MKKKRIYKPRRGIHFDRSVPQGPAASFLESSLDVVVITGSVQNSITQRAGAFSYETVPFAGYPKTSGEMSLACLGKGIWVDGFLCEDYDSGLTSSFEPTDTLQLVGTNASFRLVGFRGPVDDRAIGFHSSGSEALFQAPTSSPYGIPSGSDFALLWVSNISNVAGSQSPMFMKNPDSTNGYKMEVFGGPVSVDGADVLSHRVWLNNTGLLFGNFPFRRWHVGLLVVERGLASASLSAYDLEVGRFFQEEDVGGEGGTSGGVISIASSSFDDMSGLTEKFKIGAGTAFGYMPPDWMISAFYIASGTNAASGIIGNEQEILKNFSKILRARNGYLFSGSAEVDNSIGSFGSYSESQLVTQRELGLGTASLGRSRGYVVVTTGSIPSWTNAHIRNSAFVVTPLSASDHEVQVLGLWRSGSEAVETSAVPASASMYYSKSGKYRHVTVKKTASVLDLQRLPDGMDGFTAVYYVPGKGTDVTTVTGTLSYRENEGASTQESDVRRPCLIPIEVPYSGKIVDVKVWVELAHVSGVILDSIDGSEKTRFPLGNLALSIRSPNVRGFHAHAIRNSPVLKKVFTSEMSEFAAISGGLGTIRQALYGPSFISPFYRDTFILWEGSAPGYTSVGHRGPWDADVDTVDGVNRWHSVTEKYPTWQRDRSMRTVFTDGSRINNPRHHYGPSPSASYVGSPNSYFGYNSAYGFDVPWTSETEISGNNHQAAGSPPHGWLSGPGGSNEIDEWPTTGVNYGAPDIRPLYPLLDPIYQKKRYNDDYVRASSPSGSSLFVPDEWVGERPGLRGTEVSGTWYLLIGSGGPKLSGDNSKYCPLFFRQVRLEFILESGSVEHGLRPDSRIRPARASDEILVHTISGSDFVSKLTGSWDNFLTDTYVLREDSRSEIGRTFGIMQLTGSALTGDRALFYRLTGSIADISGSYPGWLLNNPFGVPVIPISSASLSEPDSDPPVSINPQIVLGTRAILDGARRISDAARDSSRPLTLVQRYAAVVSGTTT